ncbi:metallophosphoesterase family protein [Algoriphagus taiwanensis]|uniref:Calcineurin-like phosphoesterase domain-containing protein n=1 Tax=Algoriphagus taiwanensis TaxID=1445656 RepID=A0ABQ6Q6I8_9BACT|nr:hypothetical protein Ataiwa_37490 [Algoriphagus taiwanensis]
MKKLIYLISLLALWNLNAKAQNTASPTFGEVFFSDPTLAQAFSETFRYTGLIQTLDSGWEYLGKDSLPGIHRDIPDFDSFLAINLPHRLTFPNHSMWYRTETDLQEGILWVDADDGAQVWIDGKRVPRSTDGEYFPISQNGQQKILIRVVNNAMAGGLRRVTWARKRDFDHWKSGAQTRRDSLLLFSKNQLVKNEELKKSIQKKGLEILDQYPILFTAPVMILGDRGSYFIRWVSEKSGEARLLMTNGEEKVLISENGIFTLETDQKSLEFDLFQQEAYQGRFSFSLPEQKEKVRLAVWGDSQGGWNTFDHISKQISDLSPDFSLGAGDLVNNGSEEMSYVRFLHAVSLMKTVQIPVPGNHDYDGYYEDLNPKQMKDHLFINEKATFGLNFLGPAALLTLDPNEFFPVSIPEGSSQRDFLESTLKSEEWRNRPWKIIALHQPPFSQGWPGYQGEQSIRELLEPYFHQGLIDVVIAGHTHDYERLTTAFSGYPVTFLIVGGAGGGLEPQGRISPKPEMDLLIKKHHFGILEMGNQSFEWEVFGLEGEILDHFRIQK